MTYTANETQALHWIAKNGMSEMGGEQPSDLLEDNMSFFYPRELVKELGWSKEKVAAVLGSLMEKGLVEEVEPAAKFEKSEHALTDAGIDAAQSTW